MRRFASIPLLCLALTACASTGGGGRQAPEPLKPIDPARFYSGTWREIGRRPMTLTDGCVAGATEYSNYRDGRVRVRDTCRKGAPDGKEKAIGGPARLLDAPRNAKLRVSYRVFGIPIVRHYWVLDRADDYSWFISADPSFKDLWIYTRSPQVSAREREALAARAKALGYDVSRLEFPAQPER